MKRIWTYRETKENFNYETYEDFGLSETIARIIHNRGFQTYDSISDFIHPTMNKIHDPELLPNIHPAVDRIKSAIEYEEPILLFGDYDVDGITGSSILYRALTALGAKVIPYIPNRFTDGYGISAAPLDRILQKEVPKVVISIDNGVVAFEAADYLKQKNIDFIVADHHRMADNGLLPEATIVHPAIPDSKYPNKNLCGAGVSFKLAWQIARAVSGSKKLPERLRNLFKNLTGLVAMGTIADIMPLTEENRILVSYGLLQLEAAGEESGGVRSLIDDAKIKGPLKAGHVSYHIAPRINAAGRLGSGDRALCLLTSESVEESKDLSKELGKENEKRREIEAEIVDKAFQQVIELYGETPTNAALVLAGEDWHEGVVGIVASRVVDQFHRPALVLSILEDGKIKGSGRTCLGVDMKEALDECKDLLDKYGGHEAAVGLSFKSDNLEELRERFALAVAKQLGYDTPDLKDVSTELKIDAEVRLRNIDYKFMDELSKLEPFGMGNKKPLFSSRVKLVGDPSLIGKQKNHLSFNIEQDGKVFKALMWKRADLFDSLVELAACPIQQPFQIAFRPEINVFAGRRSIQINVQDLKLKKVLKLPEELDAIV